MIQSKRRFRLVALISGRGSNLQAVLNGTRSGELPVEMCAVISNRPDAYGLARAQEAKVPAIVLDHKAYPDRTAFETALREHIDVYAPDLVILAGFMRILGADFVAYYQGRMLNIHPSLLPKFRGLNTHARAIAAGERNHGASVHFVTSELDSGPVILQARVPVLPTDDADTLANRVLEQEHRIYPLVIRWFAQGRIKLLNDQVLLDDQVLSTPRMLESNKN
jgi:phosphoribosylglycinamide formyltransferase-1